MPATYVETREVPIRDLKPYPGNPKLHDNEEKRESLDRNGQYRSVIARQMPDGTLELLAGHGTTEVVGETRDTIRAEIIEADDETARRIVSADNQTGVRAGYDEPALLALLDAANAAGGLAGTGWDEDSYTKLLDAGHGKEPAEGNLPDDDPGDRYKEQYGVIVICDTEEDQEHTYGDLKARGFNCRVVTT